jgi:hypothetical protein
MRFCQPQEHAKKKKKSSGGMKMSEEECKIHDITRELSLKWCAAMLPRHLVQSVM